MSVTSADLQPPTRSIRSAVLRWAGATERPLPWRGERDPYRVLVSEVMLQQTQASRVVEAYRSFLRRYPTVAHLAAAEAEDVLRVWGNLGYPRRALYLWRTAQIVDERGGFPRTVPDLEALPGVGPYTARAVASFAFGAQEAVVDANVRRVLGRVYGSLLTEDVQRLADRLLPSGKAGAWNQALMDLGAIICRPRRPDCVACPLERWCAWAAGEHRTPPRGGLRVPFRETNRYARGRILAELRRRRGGVPSGRLGHDTGLGSERLAAAVEGLERDSLIHRRGSLVVLGPDHRARSRKRVGSGTR